MTIPFAVFFSSFYEELRHGFCLNVDPPTAPDLNLRPTAHKIIAKEKYHAQHGLADCATDAILAGFTILLSFLLRPSAQERAIRHLPEPASSLPILHNMLDVMIKYRGRLHDLLLDENRKHNGKPWHMEILGKPVMAVLGSPAGFEDVLKIKFDDFGKGAFLGKILEDILRQGVFGVDGMLRVHQRKTASHLFSLQMMRDTMEKVVIHSTDILCDRLDGITSNGEAANMKQLLDILPWMWTHVEQERGRAGRVRVKEGTHVMMPHYVMDRMSSVWGPDAEEYKPERWIDPNTGKLIQVPPFKFSAFLGGPRMCLGMKFAFLEMKIAMAAILSKFEVTTARDPYAYKYRQTATISIDGPLNVTLTPRHAVSA